MNESRVQDLDAVIADFLAAAEHGRRPDPAEWLRRYPALAAGLTEFFADLGRFSSFLGLPSAPSQEETVEFRAGTGGPLPGGERFGDYELLGEIGRGAMGVVYRARRVGTNLVVALKCVRPGGRFREEVANASGLRHPNIVPVYHIGEDGDRPFYTMALVEGGSLDRYLDRYRDDPRLAATLVAKVARAVHHAHQRQVLHRDLKPGNVLTDEHGEPHVADFGLATRLNEAGAADGGAPAGSLPWMAPEAVRGDATLTTAVDIWALGVILYELLTGDRPFRGADAAELRQAILKADPAAPRVLNPKIDRDLEAICRRCLARDPEGRYESASAVAIDLERWLRDEPVRARRAGRTERFGRWCRRNPAVAGGAVFLTALLLAGTLAALALAGEQEARLREQVCRGNEFAARHVASTILLRLEQLGNVVLAAADDESLRLACSRKKWEQAEAFLQKKVREHSRAGQGMPRLKSMYVLDPGGVIRAEWPQQHLVVGKVYRGRDYFHGAVRHAGRQGRDRVHLSRVFPSDNDGLDKLAISVPFEIPAAGVWVFGATITTDPTLGLNRLHDDRREAVLLAPRDKNPRDAPPPPPGAPVDYLILVHPNYVSGQTPVTFHQDVEPPARADRPELQEPVGGPPFAAEDYTDPVHGGRWLAGFAPVGNTELVVLVQQRYEDAVASNQAYFHLFLALLGGAAVLAVALFIALRLLAVYRARPRTG